MCNFLGSVSLQQKLKCWTSVKALLQLCFNADQCYGLVTAQFKRWTNVPAQLQLSFIWQAKENTSSRHEGWLTQKKQREERLNFWLLFIYFLSPPPWACPMYIWLARNAVCFTWGSHSGSWTLFCSIFMGFFLSLSFSHTILDSFFFFFLLF